MADWTWTTSDAFAAQSWAKKWWIEAQPESYFYSQGLIGADPNKYPIVEFADLAKEQGYQHTYGQIRNLTGAGVSGDSTMEGFEEAPVVYDDTVTINQKRNAIRTAGKLSEQYPSDKAARMWAVELLKRWMAGVIDQDIFTGLTSGSALTKVIYGGDATATTDIEAGDYFTLALGSKAKAYAKKATPKIQEIPYKGKKYHICIVSPDQSFDMKQRDASWIQGAKDALPSGLDNPIFTGALGVRDGVVYHDHERIATTATWGTGSNLNGATALFLGVQAGAIAFAKKRVWNEKSFDYGNQAGFCVGFIGGFSKTVLNSADNAVVGIRTYRTSN